MIIEPSKNSIKKLIVDNLDSGKLILIDPDVQRSGKDVALAEVGKQTGIPIFATKEQAYYLNRLAGCEVAWSSELDIMERGREVGFLVDEGVDLLRVYALRGRIIPQPRIPENDDFIHYLNDNHNQHYDEKYGTYKEVRIQLRTGFYNNDMFNRDILENEECDDTGEDCGTGCTPTPYATPCATPCVTPLPQPSDVVFVDSPPIMKE